MWHCIVEKATGRLVSITSEDWEVDNAARIARGVNPLPDTVVVISVQDRPDFSVVMWDAPTKVFVPRPAKVIVDRLDELRNRADEFPTLAALIQRIPSGQRAAAQAELRLALRKLLGPFRWAAENEPIPLGPETSEA